MKDKIIDFNNCSEFKNRWYNGANGKKVCIIYNDEKYMLKYQDIAKHNENMSKSNSCFSEYIACHIIETLGIEVQKTLLGKYKENLVVACRDFRKTDEILQDFASLKNTVIESSTNGNDTELTEVLDIIEKQDKMNKKIIMERFWDTFIIDTLIGNYDRHNGNWGFLVNENKNTIKLAPIYDCGSSLFSEIDESEFQNILNNKQELELKIYSRPRSSYNKKGKRINYYTYLVNTDNQDCLKSLQKITDRIDLEKINKIIDETPLITENHKKFLKVILKERKEKILDKALEINPNLVKDIVLDNNKIKNIVDRHFNEYIKTNSDSYIVEDTSNKIFFKVWDDLKPKNNTDKRLNIAFDYLSKIVDEFNENLEKSI